MLTQDSTRLLVLSNALTVAAAWIMHWPLETLLWPYWMQSVIIGWYNRRRMLALQSFSTEGLTSNDEPVEETPLGARRTANFFTLHYGFFHLIYLMFLLNTGAKIAPLDALTFAGLAVSFVVSHGTSFRQNFEADRRGRPNLGALLFVPYLRILPMHLTIIFGSGLAGSGAGTVFLFGVLKTLADVGMHKAQQRILRSSAENAQARASKS
jgi:hypothetical protein